MLTFSMQMFIIVYHLIANFTCMLLTRSWAKEQSFFSYTFMLMTTILAALLVLGVAYALCYANTCLLSFLGLTLLCGILSCTVQFLLWNWWFKKVPQALWIVFITHVVSWTLAYGLFNIKEFTHWLFGG